MGPAGEEAVQAVEDVSYVSGGAGTDSRDRLNSLAKDFNLKLVFALKSGEYPSEVGIDSMSLNPDAVLKTTLSVLEIERRLGRKAKRPKNWK